MEAGVEIEAATVELQEDKLDLTTVLELEPAVEDDEIAVWVN